jgi:hypothetical protein
MSEKSALGAWRLTLRGKKLFTKPRVALLRSIMLNHWYHHRGQLSVYLRLLDVRVPVIYGRSADERRMFGGLAFMVNGHMCCGIVGKDLVVRTGPDHYEEALSQPHARPMDFTGRPMRRVPVDSGPKGLDSTGPAFRPISITKMSVLCHRSALGIPAWMAYPEIGFWPDRPLRS